jgi:glycosyltransferase involved in cell wall biosynthesis
VKIIYLSQYFPPEIGATQTRAYEMATNLVGFGHQVTMLTEVPNHPSGIIPPKYRSRFRIVEEMKGVQVVRNWVYASPVKTFRTRMLFYLSFMLTAVVNSLFLEGRSYDAVYATSPPLFVGIAGLIIAQMRGIPFIFEVRDLWPESAAELGELRNPRYIRWGHALANLCYSRARAVVSVTQGIHDVLLSKGLRRQKVFLIKNGTNPEMYHYSYDRILEENLGWRSKFVVLYAGIHGIAQGLDNLIDAAFLLSNQSSIHFAFIGEGPRKRETMEYARKRGLLKIQFLPEIPSNEIAKYLSLASVCIVPLKKNELFRGALPSKMFDAWACGKPVLLTVDGEARRELDSAQGGVFVEPENAEALADAIVVLFENPSMGKEMGENGRKYIYEKGYIRSVQAKALCSIIENSSSKKKLDR